MHLKAKVKELHREISDIDQQRQARGDPTWAEDRRNELRRQNSELVKNDKAEKYRKRCEEEVRKKTHRVVNVNAIEIMGGWRE